MGQHKHEILIKEMLALSVAQDWILAKNEWFVIDIYFNDDFQTCLCTHYPIKEICVLKNKINGNGCEVGNVCVKNFIDPSYDAIFNGFKKILIDDEKSIGEEALVYSYEKNWINDWEYKFYCNIRLKRVLSAKQLSKKKSINFKLKVRVLRDKCVETSTMANNIKQIV